MFAKAPSLAWLLVALTCFLVGMAVADGGHQATALPPAALAVTVEVVFPPTATPETARLHAVTPTPSPAPTACATPMLARGARDVVK